MNAMIGRPIYILPAVELEAREAHKEVMSNGLTFRLDRLDALLYLAQPEDY